MGPFSSLNEQNKYPSRAYHILEAPHPIRYFSSALCLVTFWVTECAFFPKVSTCRKLFFLTRYVKLIWSLDVL